MPGGGGGGLEALADIKLIILFFYGSSNHTWNYRPFVYLPEAFSSLFLHSSKKYFHNNFQSSAIWFLININIRETVWNINFGNFILCLFLL